LDVNKKIKKKIFKKDSFFFKNAPEPLSFDPGKNESVV